VGLFIFRELDGANNVADVVTVNRPLRERQGYGQCDGDMKAIRGSGKAARQGQPISLCLSFSSPISLRQRRVDGCESVNSHRVSLYVSPVTGVAAKPDGSGASRPLRASQYHTL